MRVEATSVGDVAKHVLTRAAKIQVREVFETTLYLSVRNQMIVVTSRGGWSPFSINIPDGTKFRNLSPGDSVSCSPTSLDLGDVSVRLARAPIYHRRRFPRSRDLGSALANLENELLNATFIAKILYQSAESQLSLTDAPQFRAFVDGVLAPAAVRKTASFYKLERYEPLIGFGSGFTPSGDDFVAGVLYSYNGAGKELGKLPVRLPSGFLHTRTAWVSSMFLKYTQRGLVDESLYSLLEALWRGDGFALEDSVMTLASRGHTSGLDTSVGVLLAAAAIHDFLDGGGLLSRALDVLLKN